MLNVAETGTTHVMMIIDESGSMASLANDVRGSFNGYLDGLPQHAASIHVSATLFNIESRQLFTGVTPGAAHRLHVLNYAPHGGTALLDAVGSAIDVLRHDVTLAEGDKVLVVIHTDGEENSSREYTWHQIQDLIKDTTATGQWEYIYVGVGADAWHQSSRFAAMGTQTVNTRASGQSVGSTYATLSDLTMDYAEGTVGAVGMASAMATAEDEVSP